MPTTPTNTTTPTTPKKYARRQVKRVDGHLEVVFVDVATNKIITDLTGYTLNDGTNNQTNLPTNTGTPGTDTGGGGTSTGNNNSSSGNDPTMNWSNYWRAQNQAPGNAGPFFGEGGFLDRAITTGKGFLEGYANLRQGAKDTLLGREELPKDGNAGGKDALRSIIPGVGDLGPFAVASPVTKVTASITPSLGVGGAKEGRGLDGLYTNKPLEAPAPLNTSVGGSETQAAIKGGSAAANGTLAASSSSNVATAGLKQNGELLTNDKGWVAATANTDLPPEQRALLDTLAIGDGKGKDYWESPGYNTIVGGNKQFDDFSQHPGVVGMTGKNPDGSTWKSTAAGRYQFTGTTWDKVVPQYNKQNPKDPILDFSPRNQDRAALFLASLDYERRTGRDLYGDLKNPTSQIGQYLKVGLGGNGTDTTWQILQKKTPEEIANAFAANLGKNQQLEQTQKGIIPGSQNPNNTLGQPLSGNATLNAGAALAANGAAVTPTLQELMGKFNQLPGVTPSANAVNATNPVTGKVDTTAAALGSLNANMVGRGLPSPEYPSPYANTQYVRPDGTVTVPAKAGSAVMGADRPASLPPVAASSLFDDMFADAADRAQVNGFLETVNKSLGAPSWNRTYDGTLIADTAHPNQKSYLQDGADFTTAAGYGGITYPVWQQYAAKAGATDFSLDSQKKVMWAVADDNYKANTGRSLLDDLTSGNRDAMYSALANSANIWGSLPGGASSAMSLIEAAGHISSSAEKALALSVASNGPYKDFAFGSDGNMVLSEPINAFATSPSTVVNSSGQVMSKSAADAIREVSGASVSNAASTGSAFASSSGSSTNENLGSTASSGSGFASKGASAASSSAGSSGYDSGSSSESHRDENLGSSSSSSSGAASSGSSGASSSAGHASSSSSGSSSAASSGSSAASSGASKASSSGSSASGSQSVTTSSGSTVTKDQRDAFGGY